MLDEAICMDPDAYSKLERNCVIQCDSIKLTGSGIEIEVKSPSRDSLPKRIIINGCEYVMKEEK